VVHWCTSLTDHDLTSSTEAITEVIGPVGFAFACLGFILSTAPSVAKAGDAFGKEALKLRAHSRRLDKIQAKYRDWERKWLGFDAEQELFKRATV
jgi:hypothetical protein